jgi:hypothetical protein
MILNNLIVLNSGQAISSVGPIQDYLFWLKKCNYWNEENYPRLMKEKPTAPQ